MKKKIAFFLSLILVIVLTVTSVPIDASTVYAAKKSSSRISLNHSTYTLKKGKKLKLKATTNPKKKKVVYSSKNSKVATVNDKGVVVAKKKGKTTITAKIAGTKQTAKCTIIVGTPVSSVSTSTPLLTIKEGETSQITATISPSNASNKKLEYTSSNPNIASVDKNGVIRAASTGSSQITVAATDGSGKKANVNVIVVANETKVSSIAINPEEFLINKGEKATLSATVFPENATNKEITWSSSSTSIVSVSKTGEITGKRGGTATITATANDGSGISAKAKVTVKSLVKNINVKSETGSARMLVGTSAKLTAGIEPSDATDKSVAWKSLNSDVVSVSQDGTINAIKKGVAIITATAQDGSGVVGQISIIVKDYATNVTLEIPTQDLVAGISASNKATFYAHVDGFADSVKLYDSANNLVGTMVDDGKYQNSGDDMKGDAVYSFLKEYSNNEKGTFTYHAVAMVGNKAITSNNMNVTVLGTMSTEQKQQMSKTDTKLKSVADSFTDDKAKNADLVKSALETLKSEGNIKELGNYKAGDPIYPFTYTDGSLGGVALEPFSDDSNGSAPDRNLSNSGKLNSLMKEVPSSLKLRNSASTKSIKAGVFFGFANTSFRTGFYNTLKTDWTKLGVNYNQTKATVAALKQIDKYDLIIFSMHGSTYDGGPVLCTHESATNALDNTYYADMHNHRIARVLCKDSEEGTWDERYWVKPEFFTANYSSSALRNKIVFSETCEFMGKDGNVDNKMAKALTGIGAETVVGFHNTVLATYSRNLMKEFAEQMLVGKTTKEALTAAKNVYGANDGRKPAYPILTGKEDASFNISTDFINGSFEEQPQFNGWYREGDTRLLYSLDEIFPQDGSRMAIITTGVGSQSGNYDGTQGSYIKQDFIVPNNASTISFSYDCVSEEPMEYVNSKFDDKFAAYLLDSEGNVVKEIASETINSSTWLKLSDVDFEGGDSTAYHTGWKNASYNISAYRGKKVTIQFKVWDVGDSAYDTAGVIDNVVVK
ncbi:Ig-like domain-containing protein [Butyrivibrio sp. AE3004]|uniref:Ig-like domain-containing protein n=1 Tax=Butyrivibrio sp. AE3004 TaxID=1506994 RepID=UPI00068B1D3D|nr:Ig-like domain-containing protein [Butyrivibrio sp. AE3004]